MSVVYPHDLHGQKAVDGADVADGMLSLFLIVGILGGELGYAGGLFEPGLAHKGKVVEVIDEVVVVGREDYPEAGR